MFLKYFNFISCFDVNECYFNVVDFFYLVMEVVEFSLEK